MIDDLTHRVARIAAGPWGQQVAWIFIDPPGRSFCWNPGTDDEPGSPQLVPASVAQAILSDPGLRPHFRVEAIGRSPDDARRRRRGERDEAESPGATS